MLVFPLGQLTVFRGKCMISDVMGEEQQMLLFMVARYSWDVMGTW